MIVINSKYMLFVDTAREKNPDVVSPSIGYFTKHPPHSATLHTPPANLRHSLDEVCLIVFINNCQ